jgi:hypothetical protein
MKRRIPILILLGFSTFDYLVILPIVKYAYIVFLDELLMEPCCALKYYPHIELCVNEMLGEEKARNKQQQREKEENFGDSTIGATIKKNTLAVVGPVSVTPYRTP